MRLLYPLLVAVPASGCFFIGRVVKLSYEPSKSVVKGARKTVLSPQAFLDQREDKSSIGRSPVLGLAKRPMRARGDVAAWAGKAARAELEAAGYVFDEKSDWKVGGAVQSIQCLGGRKTTCAVQLELWVQMKDGWQTLKRGYSGEGAVPPLFAGADLFELSLREALREALGRFRRDVELSVP